MNGFAALDIHPHRRYVVDIGGRRSSRCRLHINFALFLRSMDFTQNLGVTPAWMGCLPLFCTSTSPDAAVNTQRSFWKDSMDTCIPTAMLATTRYRILPAAAAGPICAGSS